MKTIGIVIHSAEGGALCLLTACREGSVLGAFMHPTIVTSAVPLGLSMPGWESGDHDAVAPFLIEGVRRVADAGADFFVCPDNTAHLVLENIIDELPIPGLHIADVVCNEIVARGWSSAALLGTRWTMTGAVYERALRRHGIERVVPDEDVRERINAAIFDELCRGVVEQNTIDTFIAEIEELGRRGADCVILGCTEIPLIITEENSPLPIIDSTRLLARAAVRVAIDDRAIAGRGWIATTPSN